MTKRLLVTGILYGISLFSYAAPFQSHPITTDLTRNQSAEIAPDRKHHTSKLKQKIADNQQEMSKLETQLNTLEDRLKIAKLKHEQLVTEEIRRAAIAAERARLLAAENAEMKHLAELKATADAKRQQNRTQQNYGLPALSFAMSEIKRLKQQIAVIELRYQQGLAKTMQQTQKQYEAQLISWNNEKKNEFESVASFKLRHATQHQDLFNSYQAALEKLKPSIVAAQETAPLHQKIQLLTEREYTVGSESLSAELGAFNSETENFPIRIQSKTPLIKLIKNVTLPMPLSDALAFKRQWQAGLVRLNGNVKIGREHVELTLINDTNDNVFNEEAGEFITTLQKNERATERQEQVFRGEMIRIPIEHPFFIGKTEVTQAQWRSITDHNPASFSDCDNCPVEQISWEDAQEFIKQLNAKTRGGYRLPTEAEWEIACQGTTQNTYCGGNNSDEVAWFKLNSGNKTHPVGQKRANSYGLFDMSGNVWEWVQDCDNIGCNGHKLRGGSWNDAAENVKASDSIQLGNANRLFYYGFRLARTISSMKTLQ